MKEETNAYKLKLFLAFFAVYFIWGSTFSMVAIALKAFPPLVLTMFRFLIGGLCLAVFCVYRKERLPAAAEIRRYIVTGVIIFMGGVAAVVWAQQYISSSVASIIITTPFWFIVLDKPSWKANFSSPYILGGIVLGLVGVIILISNKQHLATTSANANSSLPAILIMIAGSFLWVAGSLYLKYKRGNASVFVKTCIQLLSAAALCFFICIAEGSFSRIHWSEIPLSAISALLYLSIASTTVAFIAFVWLMEHKSPAIVSTYSYINPLVAVLLGSLLLNERIVWLQIAAMIIILTGVLLINMPKYISKTVKA